MKMKFNFEFDTCSTLLRRFRWARRAFCIFRETIVVKKKKTFRDTFPPFCSRQLSREEFEEEEDLALEKTKDMNPVNP